jgi:hypothetical protein
MSNTKFENYQFCYALLSLLSKISHNTDDPHYSRIAHFDGDVISTGELTLVLISTQDTHSTDDPHYFRIAHCDGDVISSDLILVLISIQERQLY